MKLKVLGLFEVLVVKLNLIVVGYVEMIFLDGRFIERCEKLMKVCLKEIFLCICI